MVSAEMPEPIASEFRKTYEEQNLGLSLKLALENLTQRMPLLDLQMCVTAVLIQRETGGNLAEILEKVAYTIRERFRIMGDLKTLTTSSRMSAWLLCGLPIFVTRRDYGNESGLHERALERSTRTLPDCYRHVPAGDGHVDRPKDTQHKDLENGLGLRFGSLTKTKDQRPKAKQTGRNADREDHVTSNHTLNIHLYLPDNDGSVLALVPAAERFHSASQETWRKGHRHCPVTEPDLA